MILPGHQLSLAKQYLSTLPPGDASRDYTSSSTPITIGLWDKLMIALNIGEYYKKLAGFYPHHPVIQQGFSAYKTDKCHVISTLSCISLTTM
jgi:hypothetical protein